MQGDVSKIKVTVAQPAVCNQNQQHTHTHTNGVKKNRNNIATHHNTYREMGDHFEHRYYIIHKDGGGSAPTARQQDTGVRHELLLT